MKALIVILNMLLFVTPVQARYSGGTGESNDPYQIATVEDLMLFGESPEDYDKHFILTADIDLDPNLPGRKVFDKAVIAPDTDNTTSRHDGTRFAGIFDGNGCLISHLTIVGVNYLGLFGFGQYSSGAKISNLGLEAVDINGTGHFVGSLMGSNGGSISNCYSSGTVSGENSVGGLVGSNGGSISNCHSSGTVTGYEDAGGLVGSNAYGYITTSYSTGMVSGETSIGGLVGSNISGVITTSYSTNSVNGLSLVGGLVGTNRQAVGPRAKPAGRVYDSYSAGRVTGNEDVGGLVGINGPGGVISKSYSTGMVSGMTRVGGLVGDNDDDGRISSSLWDVESSAQTTSAGGTGKTTAEMQTASTFIEAGWDFIDETANGTEDIWWLLEGQSYPRLLWQYGKAFSPYPQDGAVDVPQPLILSWFPGGSGLYHDVYFGEDEEAVTNATTESQDIYRGRQKPEITTYEPSNLNLDKTYYWRIDEVKQADPNNPWKGKPWSFTTADFIVVDDFENYDADNQIWWTWRDGLGYATESWPEFGTGSAVGDETTPSYTEEMIVHDGKQSMPYWYDNNKQGYAKYSEAEKTLSYPRDWTKESVSELSLWFHGRSDFVGNFIEEPIGVFTTNSSGTDIGGERDQFHFAHKRLTGPGSIVARIEVIENTHEWAKAGVMIRQGLSEISKYAFVYVTPSNGIAFQARTEWGQTSSTTNQAGITAPLWLKLERDEAGNFMASFSVNGIAWQTVQNAVPINIYMTSNVYIGLALTAHNSDAISQAVFSNVTITGTVSEQWEHQDIGIVNNDPEPMYVAVTNRTGTSAVIYHDDPNVVRINTWTEWVIPLQTFADHGIDLTDVDQIAIGFGARGNQTIPGGRGKMYFDDIRLYPPRPAASLDLEVNVP